MNNNFYVELCIVIVNNKAMVASLNIKSFFLHIIPQGHLRL